MYCCPATNISEPSILGSCQRIVSVFPHYLLSSWYCAIAWPVFMGTFVLSGADWLLSPLTSCSLSGLTPLHEPMGQADLCSVPTLPILRTLAHPWTLPLCLNAHSADPLTSLFPLNKIMILKFKKGDWTTDMFTIFLPLYEKRQSYKYCENVLLWAGLFVSKLYKQIHL